jgi:hypothetical protein
VYSNVPAPRARPTILRKTPSLEDILTVAMAIVQPAGGAGIVNLKEPIFPDAEAPAFFAQPVGGVPSFPGPDPLRIRIYLKAEDNPD